MLRAPSTAALVVFLLLAAFPAMGEEHRRFEIKLSPDRTLRWDRGEEPVLRVRPRRGDGWITLARRYCGDRAHAWAIKLQNGGMEHPMRDRGVEIPAARLRADLRLEVARRLFPADQRVAGGYRHWVLDPFGGGEESWAWLARFYTGLETNADALRNANGGADRPRRASAVEVPETLLLRVFRDLDPVATPTPTAAPTVVPTRIPTPLPPVRTANPESTPTDRSRTYANGGVLHYGRDAQGEYAEYRLRQGEALYSAVVVRFTGQLLAKEVNATAREIARRSGIADVTSIPIGYPVRIPLDELLPEHLPPNHPRRVAWLEEQKELARFLEIVDAADLSGVHVVIDAGHGGGDSGAAVHGTWEAPYAYDIACRIKRNLERHTRATAWMTRRDRTLGFAIPGSDRLEQHRDQILLTTPRYVLGSSKIGVHLRWCLANDIFRRQGGAGVPRSKMVFLSVHADSLHPSVRGAMVYVPSRHLRKARYEFAKSGMDPYAEYRNNRNVEIGNRFRSTVEASSRHLAARIIDRLRANELEIHKHEPVRDRVIQGRQRYVPAVLKYSTAQHAILVEVCNLSNEEDREALLEAEWREIFARSVVEGMAAAFAGS